MIEACDGSGRVRRPDQVAVEYPLTVHLNDTELATLLCTPEHLEDLVVGFLHGEGLIVGLDDLAELGIAAAAGAAMVSLRRPISLADRLYARRVVATGCGQGGGDFYKALDALQIKPLSQPGDGGRHGRGLAKEAILTAARDLQTRSGLFRETGGVHTAVLCASTGAPLVGRDDIGRHNAVDKVVGSLLREPLAEAGDGPSFLMVTGRISSDIVLKAARAGLAVIASRSAPTSLAVDLAVRLNLALVGFVRGRRMNIYTSVERIG
ncbi:MAG TPA: formate dehydrogenase accessory sulfurtransferase FdhD [Bacillota bacterium]